MKWKVHSVAPRRHLVMPVLFRLLYCCGLRVSEATDLLMGDVDLDEGILTIRDSKFGRTRYVPMSKETTTSCGQYAQGNPYAGDAAGYFFPAPDGGGYNERSVYHVFRELLWNAGISHGGRGKGPRVHDFRHTFAVHFLEKWQRDGKELTIALPRLSAYLGHNDITATERYLRMPAELYPEISALLSEKYGYLIPKSGDAG